MFEKRDITRWTGYGLIISLLILLVNTATLFNLNAAKTGSISFYEADHHVITFFYAWLAVIAILLAWKLIGKFNQVLSIRVVWTFLIGLLLYGVFSTLLYIGGRSGYYGLPVDFSLLLGNFVFSFSLAYLHISGLTLAWLYFRTSRNLAVEKQKLEKEMENLQTQLLSKNLEPHFLMNTLSFLSSTMKSRPEDAEIYLDTFADVYRYFLKHNASDFVPLSEELRFLDKYILLMKKRFGDAYKFTIQVDDTSGYVLPFSLQMCVENALKHNAGSLEEPLEIKLKRKNGAIDVSNKTEPAGHPLSTGHGLKNLSQRIKLMLGRELEFHTLNNCFKVLIPVIPDVNAANKRPELG